MKPILLFLMLLALVVGIPSERITVEERCFLYFEDGIAILRYNGLIECDKAGELEAVVRIPDSFYMPDVYPTILGEGAIIGVRNIYELKLQIPEAKIIIRDGGVSYSWDLMTDPEKTAVIAFSNYYGSESLFTDLSVDQNWSVEGNKLNIHIALKNAGVYPIENLALLLQLPERRIDFVRNQMVEEEIVKFENIETSAELLYQENFFDPQSKVMGISVMEKDPLTLPPGESVDLFISADYSVINEGGLEAVIGINFEQEVDEFRFGMSVEYSSDAERMDFRRTEYYQLQHRIARLALESGTMRVGEYEI